MGTSRTFRSVVVAILKKDCRTLYPVLLLTPLLQAMSIVVARLDVWPVLTSWMPIAVFIVNTVAVFSVIQTDPPVSLTDDWLCRPVPRGALLCAKLTLLSAVIYVPRVLTTLPIDLLQGDSFIASLVDSLLLQGSFAWLYLPVVLMTAVCTANMLQGIGVLIALFVIVFVVPTPFVSPPGPETLTVGEALQVNGLQWIGMFAGKLILVIAAAVCLWAAYARRAVNFARVALGGGLLAGIVTLIAPMILLPWNSTFQLQRALNADENRDSSSFEPSLRHALACFPAARLGELAADAERDNAKNLFALNAWSEEHLQAAGKESVAFITSVSPRGLPEDWRLQVAYAKATYRKGGDTATVQLRPAFHFAASKNGFGGESVETLTHAWLLPQASLQAFGDGVEPMLELDYSVAVLKPTSAQLAVDGQSHQLPRIGTCRAKREALGDRIAVECLLAGRQPAMIAAELNDVPASRVDSGHVDYAPWPLRVLTSRRLEVSLASPDLVDSSQIKVSAYRPAAFTTAGVVTTGLLGDTRANCPLPDTHAVNARHVSSWNDDSPHESKAIEVERNVQLEVLDWGGTGKTLVLLPGLGATAHSFDDIAPLLSKHFRVVGITRRGIGYSSRPDHGYSQERLAQDVIEVLDALGIARAVLVGHSIGGEEISMIGAHHAERVAGLIYLDAAYDRSQETPTRYRELTASLPDAPRPLPEELSSYASLKKFFERTDAVPLPEGELIAMWNVGTRHLAGQRSVDARVLQAIEAGLAAPDYRSITAPALAIYATSGGSDGLKPWHDPADVALRQTLREIQKMKDELQQRQIEKFRRELQGARVLELPGASHWIMLSHRKQVIQAILDFVENSPAT